MDLDVIVTALVGVAGIAGTLLAGAVIALARGV